MVSPKTLILERFASDYDFTPKNLSEALNVMPPRIPRVQRVDTLLPNTGGVNTETAQLSARAKEIDDLLKKLTGCSAKPSNFVDDEEDCN